MPSGSFHQVDIQCPFYKFDNGKTRIRCEGFCDGATMEWVFEKPSDYLTQIREFCCNHYSRCEHCRALKGIKYTD